MKKLIFIVLYLFTFLSLVPKYLLADPIDALDQNYSLILFYSSTCAHCQKFTPVFADVVDRYHLAYEAFSMNGGTLDAIKDKTFPANQKIVSNFYQGLQEGTVPAVFLINVNTMDYLPVSIGEEPESQFINDINRTASALFIKEQSK